MCSGLIDTTVWKFSLFGGSPETHMKRLWIFFWLLFFFPSPALVRHPAMRVLEISKVWNISERRREKIIEEKNLIKIIFNCVNLVLWGCCNESLTFKDDKFIKKKVNLIELGKMIGLNNCNEFWSWKGVF